MSAVVMDHIGRLARRLGIPFYEAAALCARKGARIARERRAAKLNARVIAKPVRLWWRDDF